MWPALLCFPPHSPLSCVSTEHSSSPTAETRRSKCLPLSIPNLLDHVLSIVVVCLLHIILFCVHPGWSSAMFQPSQKKYTNEYISKTYFLHLPSQHLNGDLDKLTRWARYWKPNCKLMILVNTNVIEIP